MNFFLQQGELLILIFEFYTLSVPLLERLRFSLRKRAIFCCNNWGEIWNRMMLAKVIGETRVEEFLYES